MPRTDKPIIQRFHEKYLVNDDECWIWQAAKHSSCGYAIFSYGGKSAGMARTFIWEHANGPIPEEYRIELTCERPDCVNPEHMKLIPKTTLMRFDEMYEVDEETGCWIWHGFFHPEGYGYINYKDSCTPAHRVSYILNKGPIPDGLFVCHHCDNRKCINPEHLYVGTVQDNNNDRVVRGRGISFKGEEHQNHKLTNNAVRDIKKREYYSQYYTDKYGVSKSLISHIWCGRAWPHIT